MSDFASDVSGLAGKSGHCRTREVTDLIEFLKKSTEELHGQVERTYDETRVAIGSYLLYLGLPAAQAQEVAQEVYLRLYKTLKSGKKIENTKAWLFRVAHNEGLKVRRREKVFRGVETDWERFVQPSSSPERMLMDREKINKVTKAIGSLSPQQRNCLYLRAEGLRYREIAETLGVSSSTVNEFLRRALTRLAEAANG